MMAGVLFVLSALYLTLVVSVVISLLDHPVPQTLVRDTIRRWAKFTGGLLALGFVVQVMTWLA
jgi:uncharacterized membrane protein